MSKLDRQGFTLVEVMVVVATIGILALMGMPGIRMARERTQATAIANDVRVFTQAVEFYSTAAGSYPGYMDYTSMPGDIAEYLPPAWKNGTHHWFYVKADYYTYIYLFNLDFSTEQSIRLDHILDDGNIATGSVRVAYNGTGLIYLFKYNPPTGNDSPEDTA